MVVVSESDRMNSNGSSLSDYSLCRLWGWHFYRPDACLFYRICS